jgi:hypothetical protein
MDFGISTSWTENQAIQTLSGLRTSPVKLTHFKHWDPPTTNPHLISSQNLQYRLLLAFNADLVGFGCSRFKFLGLFIRSPSFFEFFNDNTFSLIEG